MTTPSITSDLRDVEAIQSKARLLFSSEEIQKAIDHVADEITDTLHDKAPICLAVLNGAMVFTGHLMTRLKFPLQLGYIHATRYQGEIEGNEIIWRAEPSIDLKDRHVLIIEDILDEGLTLTSVINYCRKAGATGVYTATLIDKQRKRAEGGLAQCDFTGIKIPNHFIYGFGLDYKDFLRNEDCIYIVE